MLEIRNVSKRFGGVKALDSVSMTLQPGEARALLGENGAGKSTLIKIISGMYRPDDGSVYLDGIERHFQAPEEATAAGIAVVHQERQVIERFSVAENMFLHSLPLKRGVVDYDRMNEEAKYWLEYLDIRIDPRREVGSLSPGLSQLLAIAKALSMKCKYLLLDEPTASIGGSEIDRLFEIVTELKQQGTAILFVSHKLNEVEQICDAVTVIRDGINITELKPEPENRQEMVTAMVGRQVSDLAFAKRTDLDAGSGLAVNDLTTEIGHNVPMNFDIPRGKILGMYGLVGAGRTELARAIVGLETVRSGEIHIGGKVSDIKNPSHAMRKYKLGYVSEDRKGEGLLLSLSIERNSGITIWNRLARFGFWLTSKKSLQAVLPVLESLNVKMASARAPVSSLSGGNQQKVSVSKWLSADADVLVFDEPTVGIDVGAKNEMHTLIHELALNGKTILLISSDLAEVIQLSDSIAVVADFEIKKVMENNFDYEDMSTEIMRIVTNAAEAEIQSVAL